MSQDGIFNRFCIVVISNKQHVTVKELFVYETKSMKQRMGSLIYYPLENIYEENRLFEYYNLLNSFIITSQRKTLKRN